MERILFIQAIETIRAYEENVVTSVADANIGSIFGWGFDSNKGGTLQFVNNYGIQEFEKKSIQLEKKYGERFKPPKMLKEMSSKKEMF